MTWFTKKLFFYVAAVEQALIIDILDSENKSQSYFVCWYVLIADFWLDRENSVYILGD